LGYRWANQGFQIGWYVLYNTMNIAILPHWCGWSYTYLSPLNSVTAPGPTFRHLGQPESLIRHAWAGLGRGQLWVSQKSSFLHLSPHCCALAEESWVSTISFPATKFTANVQTTRWDLFCMDFPCPWESDLLGWKLLSFPFVTVTLLFNSVLKHWFLS
jgi:hypothetical protein